VCNAVGSDVQRRRERDAALQRARGSRERRLEVGVPRSLGAERQLVQQLRLPRARRVSTRVRRMVPRCVTRMRRSLLSACMWDAAVMAVCWGAAHASRRSARTMDPSKSFEREQSSVKSAPEHLRGPRALSVRTSVLSRDRQRRVPSRSPAGGVTTKRARDRPSRC